MARKETIEAPRADREPLHEESCRVVERMIWMCLTAILRPDKFPVIYKRLYPLDTKWCAILFFSDACLLLSLVAKSRQFRREVHEYRKLIGEEKDVWTEYKKDKRLAGIELSKATPLDAAPIEELEKDTSYAKYQKWFFEELERIQA